jgi:phosphoglucomutase
MDEILEENHVPFEEIHGYIDPYFGGIAPSCTEENLAELKDFVKEKTCHLGVSFDADGDRFGIINEKGQFVTQNLILALLLDYVIKQYGWTGGVACSVATTHLLDRIARKHGLPMIKTPVGFKYIADHFLNDRMIFGGEESASFTFKDHLPEKDGIMAGLFVIEMMATKGKSLTEQIQDLFKEYGKRVSRQATLSLTPERQKKLNALCKRPLKSFKGRKVVNAEFVDGYKLNFQNDDWILFRCSGTEPFLRCYAEAENKKSVDLLIEQGLELIN